MENRKREIVPESFCAEVVGVVSDALLAITSSSLSDSDKRIEAKPGGTTHDAT
jgi:hypothetical protein